MREGELRSMEEGLAEGLWWGKAFENWGGGVCSLWVYNSQERDCTDWLAGWLRDGGEGRVGEGGG